VADTKLNRLTLTVKQAQHMLQLLEQNAKGYDRAQLRKLDRLGETIEEYAYDLVQKHEVLFAKFKEEMRLPSTSPAEAEVLQETYSVASKELNETLGSAEVSLLLDKSEVDFLNHAWSQIGGFRGFKDIRRSIEGIYVALESITPVVVEEAKKVVDEPVKPAESGNGDA